MQDLWKSRQCLEMVEGFDHRSVNKGIGACGRLPPPDEGPILPYAVWQCGRYKVFHFYICQNAKPKPWYNPMGANNDTILLDTINF
jgi:hypothetical protein